MVSAQIEALKTRIIEIAHARRRFGYRRVHDLLRPEFPGVNHKQVYRLYSAVDLAVRKRKKVRRAPAERTPLNVAVTVNEVWSMDLVGDSLANGRRLKCLTVADDFSHESVDIAVDYGISGQYVTRLLDQAARFGGYPAAVRTDNGPEFTSRAFIGSAQTHGIRHILIEPGRPMQNGYIESFNGRFRDECLNEHWFETLLQARTEIAAWRRDYNNVRPHGSIGRVPPAQFAEQHRRHAGEAAFCATRTVSEDGFMASHHVQAAVDHQGCPGDERSLVGRQPEDWPRDLFRACPAREQRRVMALGR